MQKKKMQQTDPQMIPIPLMIPILYHKWSQTRNGRLAIKDGKVGLRNLNSGFKIYTNRFFIIVKTRKPWAFGFDSKWIIVYWTNHNKVQDTRENLKTTTIYRWFVRFSFHTLNWLFPCYAVIFLLFTALSFTVIIPYFYTEFTVCNARKMCSMNDLNVNFTT